LSREDIEVGEVGEGGRLHENCERDLESFQYVSIRNPGVCMKRHLAIWIGLLLLPARQLLAQDETNVSGVSEVRTVGTAQRTVRPDLAVVTLEFSAVGASPREAGQRVAARADSLRRALYEIGIPRDSLVSGSRWQWWGGRLEVLPGDTRQIPPPPGTAGPTLVQRDTAYRAHEVVEVRIRDLSKVGPVIDVALGLRITQISGIRFSAGKTEAAREEALREASVSARKQAETIAAASGGKLGRILSLSTQPSYSENSSIEVMLRAGEASSRTKVVEPQIPVTATVHGRWELVGTP
jgi:uncharacterized protein YggE